MADRLVRAPAQAEGWGWRRIRNGQRWAPHGIRIGWVAGNELFLDSAASYEGAQELAEAEGICMSEQTLRHRLQQRGLLVSIDAGREMVQVRRTLEGRARQVLHLRASDLVGGVKQACGKTPSKATP